VGRLYPVTAFSKAEEQSEVNWQKGLFGPDNDKVSLLDDMKGGPGNG
jgi:hypothetical protein